MLKYLPKIGLCFLFIFRSFFLFAQQDTVEFVQSNVVVDSNHSLQTAGKIAGIAIPSLMVGYGILSFESKALQDWDSEMEQNLNDNNASFLNRMGYCAALSPAALAFGLNLAGNKGKHDLFDMAALYALSNVLDAGIVFGLKFTTGRERPNGTNTRSFPSGHAATAFVAAEFLRQEYGDKSVWYGIGGYTMATAIGISRIFTDSHRFSDVVAGAGIGILSTKFVYYVYPYIQKTLFKKDTQSRAAVFPGYNEGGFNLNVSYVF